MREWTQTWLAGWLYVSHWIYATYKTYGRLVFWVQYASDASSAWRYIISLCYAMRACLTEMVKMKKNYCLRLYHNIWKYNYWIVLLINRYLYVRLFYYSNHFLFGCCICPFRAELAHSIRFRAIVLIVLNYMLLKTNLLHETKLIISEYYQIQSL